MQRRSLLILGALAPAGLFGSRYLNALTSKVPSPTEQRESAERLNELAANIQTPANASRLVDLIAELFSKETPPALLSSRLRSRISQAEFSAVSDPNKLIPELRLAEAWNAYAETMQVPETCRVTVPEVHYLRDAFLTTARVLWNRGVNNIWSVPSIYATEADGVLAPGCRAIESIRILWDLANMPDNLKGARDGVSKGVLFSELFRQQQTQAPASAVESRSMVVARGHINPIEIAERQYTQAHGRRAFSKAVITMLDSVLAPGTKS